MSNKACFAWVKVNSKFWPVVFYYDYQNTLKRVLETIIYQKELIDDEKDLTLDQLVVKFPCPIFNVDE